VPTKEFEELPKCKDLEIKVSRMWDIKATTMPLLNEYVENIPGSSVIGQMQKITWLGAVHILREVFSTT